MSFGNEFRIHGKLASDVARGRTARGITTAFYVVEVTCRRSDDVTLSTTDFIPITTYGKQAENDLRFLAKGKEVAVHGRIRSWYDPAKKCGGFCVEPFPRGVRYKGAPVARSGTRSPVGEHDDWIKSYNDNIFRFDDATCQTRPSRTAAHA